MTVDVVETAATAEDEAALLAADAADEAAFASGFPDQPPAKGKGSGKGKHAADKPEDKSEAAPTGSEPLGDADRAAAVVADKPEYVQVSKKDWEDVRAAAARVAGYDSQFARLSGTVGHIQKTVNGLQAPAATRRFEMPPDAFATMERDFPELAQQNKAAITAAFAAMNGPGGGTTEFDEARIEAFIAAREGRKELEKLTKRHPDWAQIVGAVNINEQQPDANNAFRKWLATKPKAFQDELNGSNSAAEISDAIRNFQADTKTAAGRPAVRPRDDARGNRIAMAVQPKGDNAGAAAGGKTDEQEFEAGFNSR